LVQAITADNFFGSLFATPGDVDNYDNSIRISNSVKYTSPVFAGFQGEVLYGFGQQSGSISDRRAWGAAVAYTNGPVALAASYQFYDGGSTLATPGFNTSTTDSVFNGPINNGYESAKSIKIARVAGMYTIGAFGLGASYSNSQYTANAFSSFGSTEKYNTGNAFVNWQATPAVLTSVGYSYVKASGDTSAKYHQVSLGADYSLSKRTDVYLAGVYQHASGENRSVDTGAIIPASPSIASYGFAGTSGASQELVTLGIRHRF
jgi:predicted porin